MWWGSAPGGGEGGSSSPLPLPRRGGAHPHAWRKKRRGGHGLRLKITPRGSTPCGRRSQAHLSPRPPPGAPFPLSCHHLTEKTHMSRYGRDALVSLAYLQPSGTIAILHPSQGGWGRGCLRGEAGDKAREGRGTAERGHDAR